MARSRGLELQCDLRRVQSDGEHDARVDGQNKEDELPAKDEDRELKRVEGNGGEGRRWVELVVQLVESLVEEAAVEEAVRLKQ